MTFEKFFRLISYAAVFCGFLSLWVSGSFGILVPAVFISILIAAWFLEDSKWQISERWGTALIVLALPAFILGWRFQLFSFSEMDTAVAGILARLILSLTAIKLLQEKSSRDWVFLYLMSFFEVMLGAGLSISGLYLLSFLIYLLVMVCAIIAFEIRKTARAADQLTLSVKPDVKIPPSRLPVTSVVLIAFISSLAVPLFFMLPRVGGAGFGGTKNDRARSGFSETVSLGGIGEIQESDAVVMRVKLDKPFDPAGLYFRGIALDTFDNLAWKRSMVREPFEKGERDTIQIDNASSREDFSIQTIYLEPLLDTPVLFALPRAIVVQGSFSVLYKDQYGAISFPSTAERVSYKVLSDRGTPSAVKLRADQTPYAAQQANYLQLPAAIDPRISELTKKIIDGSGNRYDQAAAVETFLRTSFGYTLQRKAGGPEPLSDFLFNIREGHCEYFATAMAVMLRTQGIATRIVNGFHGGEFNDAADVTIVRERNAHAWVEVYFPAEDAWVTFDPTPSAGQSVGFAGGLTGTFRKYADALETFWIQYFVAFDDQEQRSLARSVRSGMADFQMNCAMYLDVVKNIIAAWWAEVKGVEGGQARMYAVGQGVGVLALIGVLVLFTAWFVRSVVRSKIWLRFRRKISNASRPGIIAFYERMLEILADRGIQREPFQTPVEFAESLAIPEAVRITEKYNGVRFGQRDLSVSESDEINEWLRAVKASDNTA